MPCNTAHYYLPGIREAVNIPVLDMIVLTVARLRTMGAARVGLLASTAVLKLGLYEQALATQGIAMAVPADQDGLMDVIRAVKRGDQGEAVRGAFRDIAGQLLDGGVDCLVIACTELSVLVDSLDRAMPVLDAMDVLVAGVVAFGTGPSSPPPSSAAT
jgi:aspartate racemase